MRAVMVGNGYIGGAHRSAYKRLKDEGKDIELVAVCDVRESQRKETNGAKAYADFDEMLKAEQGNFDYVDICLPTYLHAEYTVKALKAGYHVLCEKPMALTEEETKLMLDTAKETGKTVYAGPIEATALGNIGAQLLNDGSVSDIEAVRALIRESFPIKTINA